MHLLFPFFIKHDLPSLKCSEEDCLADFLLRRDARMSNPGACSLEFQNVMQILTECLLKWDTKTQSSKGKGILGTVIAFAGADEEQGRKTLHRHWQIWVKEIDQNIRDCLFHKDDKTRLEARDTFIKHIDDVISADYGSDLYISHRCVQKDTNEELKIDIADNLLKEKKEIDFRRARHKELYDEVKGNIMYCAECDKTMSTVDIVNNSLKRWRDTVLSNERAQHNRPDTNIPLTPARLDMAAYTFSYHMNGGCALEKDCFWGNMHVRETLLKHRFEEHSSCHCGSCFKKSCECRFMFPFMSTPCTYIHEDKGDNNKNETLWYSLDGSVNTVYPFIILPKRPMGCQYLNSHNTTISYILNCNNNIQIGDASQVFYSTLYTSKSTQEEDSEKQLRIGRAVIKRIKRVLDEKNQSSTTSKCNNEDTTTNAIPVPQIEPGFGEGLSRLLSGMNAATTRNVISATMAHLIPCNNGSRFVFSHDFSDLLVGQMEATLEGEITNVRIRSNKLNNKTITWPESLADDYLHRPSEDEFENICFYDLTRRYKKNFKSYNTSQFNSDEVSNIEVRGARKYKFNQTHPGYQYSYLTELTQPTIPRIALPKDKLCALNELQLNAKNPTEDSIDKREIYAKMALLMFYPFRKLSDLTCEKSYWKKFHQELTKHIKSEETIFWKKGFEILQNIQDRDTLQKHVRRARDPICMVTVNEKPDEKNKSQNESDKQKRDNVRDILQVNKQFR